MNGEYNSSKTWKEVVEGNPEYNNLPRSVERIAKALMKKKNLNFNGKLKGMPKEKVIELLINTAKERGDLSESMNTMEDFVKWYEKSDNETKTYVDLASRTEEYKSEFVNKLLEMHPELRKSAPKLPGYISSLSPYLGRFRVRKSNDVFADLSSFMQYLPNDAIPNLDELIFKIAKHDYMPKFNESPEGAIKNIKEKISEEKNERMKKLESNILDYCNDIYNTKIPGHGSIRGQKDDLETKIRSFQVEGAKFIADNERSLLADEMGMFKTSQAIFARYLIEEKEGKTPTLIVCPNSVKEHWVKEILKWSPKDKKPKIALLESDNAEVIVQVGEHKKTENISFDDKQINDLDFIIVNYDLISRRDTDIGETRFSAIKNFNPRYVIFDEIHNAKNPSAIRTRSTKEIADSAKHLALLSGTPIPNSITDLYMLLSYLDPSSFKVDFDDKKLNSKLINGFYQLYNKDPAIIKKVFEKRKLRRRTADYLKREVPALETGKVIDVKIPLTGDHAKVYNEIYKNESCYASQNLIELLKASLDPNLVNPEYIEDRVLRSRLGRIESCKYKKLDEIIEEETKAGRKVLVFTSHFKDGVTSNNDKKDKTHIKEIRTLRDRYKGYDPLVVDGDISTDRLNGKDSEREQIRKKFQFDPNYKLLIATIGTMNEGVDLTAADTIVFLDQAYTPALMQQAIKRSQRPGEIKKDSLKAYRLISTLPDKRSIDQGVIKMLDEKEKTFDFLVNALPLNIEDLRQVETDKISKSPDVKSSLPLTRQKVSEHLGKFTGKGGDTFKKWVDRDKEGAERFAQSYAAHLDCSYSGNTARVYTKLINGLEKVENLEKKVDLASGPAVMSYFLKKPTTSVDVNPYNLKAGKILASKGSEFKEGMLDKLPLDSKNYDLAMCSLALHLLSAEKKGKSGVVREREQAIKEANRVLKKGGYYITTIPQHCIAQENLPKLYEGLDKLGFEVVPDFSGYAKAKEKDKNFRVYVAVAKKVNDSPKENLDENYFKWCKDKSWGLGYDIIQKTEEHKKPRKKKSEVFVTEEKLKCENFELNSHDLDSAIQNYINKCGREK